MTVKEREEDEIERRREEEEIRAKEQRRQEIEKFEDERRQIQMDHRMRPKYNFIDMIENGPVDEPMEDGQERIGMAIETRRIEQNNQFKTEENDMDDENNLFKKKHKPLTKLDNEIQDRIRSIDEERKQK